MFNAETEIFIMVLSDNVIAGFNSWK